MESSFGATADQAVVPPEAAARTLSTYAGPALLLDSSGTILDANTHATALRQAADAGLLPNLRPLTQRAASDLRAIVEVLVIPAAAGSQILEAILMPAGGDVVLLLAKDVTLERNLRAALVESRQRYKDLVEISSDFAWEIGPDGRFVFVSPRGALGHRADELVGRLPAEFVVSHPGLEDATPFLAREPVEEVEVWLRRIDGSAACLLSSAAPLLGPDGEWRGARGVCRDVTSERERDAALARAHNRERLLTYIVRTIRDVVDPADMLKAAAEATARALGAAGCQIFRAHPDSGDMAEAASFGETTGPDADLLARLTERGQVEEEGANRRLIGLVSRYRHSVNGAVLLWRRADSARWNDDERLLVEDVATQIGIANEQIANHERILTLSRTDGLTGLFNRRAFFEELVRRFNRLEREQRSAALIYVDLDNFKLVNDVHGHRQGDEALVEMRNILLRHSRPTDLVARLGGDEFGLWLEGADAQLAERRAGELLEAGRQLDRFSGGEEHPLHFSIGVAVHDPDNRESLHELLARADEAMYEAKRGGKGGWRMAPIRKGEEQE